MADRIRGGGPDESRDEGRGEGDEPGARRIRVLIVDDQTVIREGLTLMLTLLDELEVVGSAANGAEAVRLATRIRPDVVLMDLKMPVVDGVEATRQLVGAGLAGAVVVLTTYLDDDWVFPALQAGARGFLTKDADAADIKKAIVTVAAGQAQLEPGIQRRLVESLVAGARIGVVPAASDDPADRLTSREEDVLLEVARGLGNEEIARRLYVTEATIKTHVNHLLAKTRCRDRAALVAYAFRTGRARP